MLNIERKSWDYSSRCHDFFAAVGDTAVLEWVSQVEWVYRYLRVISGFYNTVFKATQHQSGSTAPAPAFQDFPTHKLVFSVLRNLSHPLSWCSIPACLWLQSQTKPWLLNYTQAGLWVLSWAAHILSWCACSLHKKCLKFIQFLWMMSWAP